jgi:ketosteroid isomerase-like protein
MARVAHTIFTLAAVAALAACSGKAPEAAASPAASAAPDGGQTSPADVVEQHVKSMKSGDLDAIMSDYADDAVVIAPEGLVKDQIPAKGPGVFSGAADARRVFATLTAPDNLGAIKGMETRVEPKGSDIAFLYWTQFKGQPNQVTGRDVFVVRNSKIVFQDIIPDAK